MKYGVLLTVAQTVNTIIPFCLLWKLDEITDVGGIPLISEFQCPLLILTSDVYCVRPLNIIKSISVVHECSCLCSFVSDAKFHNDYSNKLFCLNIFCTGNY